MPRTSPSTRSPRRRKLPARAAKVFLSPYAYNRDYETEFTRAKRTVPYELPASRKRARRDSTSSCSSLTPSESISAREALTSSPMLDDSDEQVFIDDRGAWTPGSEAEVDDFLEHGEDVSNILGWSRGPSTPEPGFASQIPSSPLSVVTHTQMDTNILVPTPSSPFATSPLTSLFNSSLSEDEDTEEEEDSDVTLTDIELTHAIDKGKERSKSTSPSHPNVDDVYVEDDGVRGILMDAESTSACDKRKETNTVPPLPVSFQDALFETNSFTEADKEPSSSRVVRDYTQTYCPNRTALAHTLMAKDAISHPYSDEDLFKSANSTIHEQDDVIAGLKGLITGVAAGISSNLSELFRGLQNAK